jgi:hypothetical protein
MSPRRACLEVDSQGSYPKGAKASAEKIKQKSRSYGGLSKGSFEAEGASLRDIRRYLNRGKLGESANFHRSRRLSFLGDGGRLCQACSRIETIRFHSIISLQEVKRVV